MGHTGWDPPAPHINSPLPISFPSPYPVTCSSPTLHRPLYPVTSSSGSVPIATNSRHSHPGQTHSGCLNMIADRLSQPNHPITTEWSLNPKIVTQILGTWGTPTVDSPQHASSPVYFSNLGASSTGDRCSVTRLAGKVDVNVSTIHPAQQSYSETQDHPGGRSDTNSHLVAVTTLVSNLLCRVDHPLFLSYHRDLLSQQGYVSDGHTVCMLGGSCAALPSDRIFE